MLPPRVRPSSNWGGIEPTTLALITSDPIQCTTLEVLDQIILHEQLDALIYVSSGHTMYVGSIVYRSVQSHVTICLSRGWQESLYFLMLFRYINAQSCGLQSHWRDVCPINCWCHLYLSVGAPNVTILQLSIQGNYANMFPTLIQDMCLKLDLRMAPVAFYSYILIWMM